MGGPYAMQLYFGKMRGGFGHRLLLHAYMREPLPTRDWSRATGSNGFCPVVISWIRFFKPSLIIFQIEIATIASISIFYFFC